MIVFEKFLTLGKDRLLVDVLELVLHLLELAEHFPLRSQRLAVRVVLPRIEPCRHCLYLYLQLEYTI